MDKDLQIRIAAFDWLSEQTDLCEDVLPRSLLQKGFLFQEQHVPLISPQGIFKPRVMDYPLTITTAPHGPYDDNYVEGKFLEYRYRGSDPMHRDNVGLRKLLQLRRPLIYLYGLVPSRYLPIWPVYIVADHPERLTFEVAVDNLERARLLDEGQMPLAEGAETRREYITSTARVRLHQRSFRERVIEAYRSQCALCRLRHRELLDAAHIVPDVEQAGTPLVNNGISLCKLHHAAFDRFMIGITPDYEIQIREDILHEDDGPMLVHGLQELHGGRIYVPSRRSDRPSRESLEWRFERFLAAGS
jgi:putative restriction endonuclease